MEAIRSGRHYEPSEARSREAAKEIVGEMNGRGALAGVSAEKSEMDFDFGSAIATYYDLHTIFRELRHRSEDL